MFNLLNWSWNRPPKHYLKLEITDEVMRRIEMIQVKSSLTTVGLVRRSLALYEFAVNQNLAGNKLILRCTDGSEAEVPIDEE